MAKTEDAALDTFFAALHKASVDCLFTRWMDVHLIFYIRCPSWYDMYMFYVQKRICVRLCKVVVICASLSHQAN